MALFILACSGPGAMLEIHDNIVYAQQHAMVVVALATISSAMWLVVRRFKFVPICVLTLLLVHPAWTISAIQGDCGTCKAQAATFVTVVAAFCVGIQVLLSLWSLARQRAPGNSF